MSKIHYIIDIIGQFLSTNRIAFEETEEVLIFNLRQSFIFFFNRVRMYESWRRFLKFWRPILWRTYV